MVRVTWWGTGAAAFVLLVLGAGLPLLDRVLGLRGQPLAPGTVVSVGTERGGVRPVTFSVTSSGWALNRGDTSLSNGAELFSGDVVFDLNVVVPLGSADARALWGGLGRIVAAGGHARLGTGPVPVTTAQGVTGLTGRLAGRERVGTATVLAKGTLGASVTATGPPHAFRKAVPQVEAMVRTIRIAAPWG
ncbi:MULTISPECIES: hypothetical protein [unclassified Actinomadura]|uniref:hypothetical protein n=1 Tax=unclassified Actinomadura TaxID=2626254 RepID=UPI0011EC1DA6|nr:hypothetical protein [Actinomadura sp. K4S16]